MHPAPVSPVVSSIGRSGPLSAHPSAHTPVRLIRAQDGLEAVIPALMGARELAVDTEFHAENTYLPRPMLLQICDPQEILLIDLQAQLDLRVLARVLARVPLLLHAGQVDVQILRRLTGVQPIIAFDTQVAAGCLGQGYPLRLGDLVWKNLGIEMSKGETLSDWSRRPLTPEQIYYAAEDVRVLGRLAEVMRGEVEARGLGRVLAAATQEFVEDEESPAELWRLIGGAHLLDAEGRAALQRLTVWRDRAAGERGQSRPSILSDGLLLELARRRPNTLEGVGRNRRMPGAVFRREGQEVFAALSATSPAPRPVWGKPKAWVEIVRAAARIAEAERGISAEILLPESALMALSHGDTIPSWRQEALGENFMAFLEGRRLIGLNQGWCEIS